jgi:hypothetical protein
VPVAHPHLETEPPIKLRCGVEIVDDMNRMI